DSPLMPQSPGSHLIYLAVGGKNPLLPTARFQESKPAMSNPSRRSTTRPLPWPSSSKIRSALQATNDHDCLLLLRMPTSSKMMAATGANAKGVNSSLPLLALPTILIFQPRVQEDLLPRVQGDFSQPRIQ
ncbi:hypothetical protein ACLOJK_022600, partial [Asimina triloba]